MNDEVKELNERPPPAPLSELQVKAMQTARAGCVAAVISAEARVKSVLYSSKRGDFVLGSPARLLAAEEQYRDAVAALNEHDAQCRARGLEV